MAKHTDDAHALKVAKELKQKDDWKRFARLTDEGYYDLRTDDTGDVPVRLFLTPTLLQEAEDILYRQIINATRFPGTRLVVITPDTHYGYGVPVGCVLLTDADAGAIAMGPVGFDIGCFRGDTLIPILDGNSYRIDELAARDEELFVYALSTEQKVVAARATAKRTRMNAPLVRVTLDNGREIYCTPDHDFMLRDGSYQQAQFLEPQTSLMGFTVSAELDASRNSTAVFSHGSCETVIAYGVSRGNDVVSMRQSHVGAAQTSVAPTGLGVVCATLPTAYAVGYDSAAPFRGLGRKHAPLTCGDSETPLRSRIVVSREVVSIEFLNESADVYCLAVPGYGNFALDAGVFVHNCGMMSARSETDAERATPKKRLEFNRAVMERVAMGAGGRSVRLGKLTEGEFENLVRGGAEYYVEKYGATFDRSHAERHRIPVDDEWQIPWGGKGRPERGRHQLGSLGGGNHFIELQREERTNKLFVQVHTGSRGFGHGLATNYFEMAREERPAEIKDIDLGYFTPESEHYADYLNAVAAGGNFAILNRLVIYEALAEAFEEVFNSPLELIYEISHNLVQREEHPEFGSVWVHRKGATRAFPAGHPALAGTIWEETGHPVLIPGSNKDWSFVLRPQAGAVKSGYSVNHGAGRRLSRSAAMRQLSQEKMDKEYAAAGILVNTDGHVPLDEAAPCYKSSEEVVAAVVAAGLATIEHRLYPLASLKGTDETKGRGRKGKRDKDRNKPRDRHAKIKTTENDEEHFTDSDDAATGGHY